MAFIEDDFGHWLAGFVDGEGCFAIAPNKNGFVCFFQLLLREDDFPVLEMIQEKLGFGWITIHQSPSAQHPVAIFRTTRKEECARLVEIFDRYPLRAKKSGDFEVWKLAVAEWMTVRKGARNNWSYMAELHQALKDNRLRKAA